MTRVLSELLGAPGPAFRTGLQQLEISAGRPNADIRLTTELQQHTRAKLKELGLDPEDTTGVELHAALGERLRRDEERFVAAISKGSAKADDPVARVAVALVQHIMPKTCFAMKPAAAKKLLKANVPKKAMKALGYRSLDSMIKHESAASLFAAAWLVESSQWVRRMLGSYAKLKASDFEVRDIAIEYPKAKRWSTLSESVLAAHKHNIFGFKELGTVVILPLPESRPDLSALTTATLTLHAINEIYSSSTYLKLHQVRPNFGATVKEMAEGKAVLAARLLDRPVSWQVAQRYYARFANMLQTDIFEPVLQAEDFAWHAVEQVLSRIEPSLEFWHGTTYLAHQASDGTVSCNLADQLLTHCNRLPFHMRFTEQLKQELTAELTLRYLNPQLLQESITGQLQAQLAYAPAGI